MSRVIIITLFSLSALAFVVVEMLARRPDSRIPTFGAITGFVMGYQVGRIPVGRIAVLGFWWWIGWHFFAR